MLQIPRETNNIICLSVLRGINRGQIVSHGSLWRQVRTVCVCVCVRAHMCLYDAWLIHFHCHTILPTLPTECTKCVIKLLFSLTHTLCRVCGYVRVVGMCVCVCVSSSAEHSNILV